MYVPLCVPCPRAPPAPPIPEELTAVYELHDKVAKAKGMPIIIFNGRG